MGYNLSHIKNIKQEFWGPRKTWVKETPLPANLEEQPTVWVMFAILFSDIRKTSESFKIVPKCISF